MKLNMQQDLPLLAHSSSAVPPTCRTGQHPVPPTPYSTVTDPPRLKAAHRPPTCMPSASLPACCQCPQEPQAARPTALWPVRQFVSSSPPPLSLLSTCLRMAARRARIPAREPAARNGPGRNAGRRPRGSSFGPAGSAGNKAERRSPRTPSHTRGSQRSGRFPVRGVSGLGRARLGASGATGAGLWGCRVPILSPCTRLARSLSLSEEWGVRCVRPKSRLAAIPSRD
jgi:hypothetical protein